jgi:hypothetical protein
LCRKTHGTETEIPPSEACSKDLPSLSLKNNQHFKFQAFPLEIRMPRNEFRDGPVEAVSVCLTVSRLEAIEALVKRPVQFGLKRPTSHAPFLEPRYTC